MLSTSLTKKQTIFYSKGITKASAQKMSNNFYNAQIQKITTLLLVTSSQSRFLLRIIFIGHTAK
jgi:hypothetical protein